MVRAVAACQTCSGHEDNEVVDLLVKIGHEEGDASYADMENGTADVGSQLVGENV